MESLSRLLCAIRGHEDYLHFDKNRLCLKCVACGYKSPGWTIDDHRPVLRFPSRAAAKVVRLTEVQKVA